MYYEINVSCNGRHYFATHERSIRDEKSAWMMVQQFRILFPENMGYRVECTKFETIGRTVNF